MSLLLVSSHTSPTGFGSKQFYIFYLTRSDTHSYNCCRETHFTRGEFNNGRARRALVDWYLSLFVMCKAWHQYNEGLKALALLNSPQVKLWQSHWSMKYRLTSLKTKAWGRSGRALDSKSKGCRLSLTGGTALCPWARHINPCFVLVQSRKVRPDITEKWLTGT